MRNYSDVFATMKNRQAFGRARVNARQTADVVGSAARRIAVSPFKKVGAPRAEGRTQAQLQADAEATKRANQLISQVTASVVWVNSSGTVLDPALFIYKQPKMWRVNPDGSRTVLQWISRSGAPTLEPGTPPPPAVLVPSYQGPPIQQVNPDGTPIQYGVASDIAAAIAAKILAEKQAAEEAVRRSEETYRANQLVSRVETPIQQVNPNGTPLPTPPPPEPPASVVPVDASRDPGYVAPLATTRGSGLFSRMIPSTVRRGFRMKGLGWSVFNPRPDERDMVPREMILNNISGIFLSAPPGSKFYVRTDDTLAKFNDLARRAAALGKIQGAVYDKILVENHIDKLLLKMEQWKQSGKGHTGALSSAKIQLEALEAMVKNMESDVSKRAYDEQLVVSRRMFQNALGMYNRDATTAATQPARPTGNRYNYYGYNPILHVRGNRPPVLKGLGMFRLGAMSYDSFLASFNATVSRFNTMSGVVGALGQQALTAFNNLVNQPLGSGRTEGGGMMSGIESIRFDIKHYPGKMDSWTLNALNTKMDVLDKVVLSMKESPSAPTQDDENARALEYMKGEVDSALIEKNAALAAAAKWGWLAAPLGVSWTLWGVGAAGLTALVGVTYAVGRSR